VNDGGQEAMRLHVEEKLHRRTVEPNYLETVNLD